MKYPKSCEWCVYRDRRNANICRHCSFNESTTASFELGKVDIFELAKGLRRKQYLADSTSPTPPKREVKQPVELDTCPQCGEVSLFYNSSTEKHECLNVRCRSHDIFANVIWPGRDSAFDRDESVEPRDLSNPLLLSVKMFLAEVRSWRCQYRDGEYVCTDFAREVYDAATAQRIRCGYVVISFTRSPVGHAIVAFETDCGLKFFEPQNGNEQEVILGRPYSSQARGILDRDTVRLVEISWNDGTSTRID